MSLTEKARTHLTSYRNPKVSFLQVYSNLDKEFPMPREQTPYIFFVLDGELRLYTPSGIMDYVAGQYSISAIDTPERDMFWLSLSTWTFWLQQFRSRSMM